MTRKKWVMLVKGWMVNVRLPLLARGDGRILEINGKQGLINMHLS